MQIFFFMLNIEGTNGYLMVTANGGMNQQRVAVSNVWGPNSYYDYLLFFAISWICIACRITICLLCLVLKILLWLKQVCNAVVIARLLNSTLVVPRFMYSSVWRDVRWYILFLFPFEEFLSSQVVCWMRFHTFYFFNTQIQFGLDFIIFI